MRTYTTGQLIQILSRDIGIFKLRAEDENSKRHSSTAAALYKFVSKMIAMDTTLNAQETIALLQTLKGEFYGNSN